MLFGLFKKKEKVEIKETKEPVEKKMSDNDKYKMFAGIDRDSVK